MDPLAQLADIKTPEPISQFPIAIGWWLLLIITIVLISYLSIKYYRLQQHKKVQKQAINALQNQTLSIAENIKILKWAAMHYFSRQAVASLSGQSLADFLTAQLPSNKQQHFIEQSHHLWSMQYQKTQPDSSSNQQFTAASLYWLNNALPPKHNKEAIND